ncbi:MAG: hypothetical protein QW424_04685 [Candidatus Bathyarchaeia archaeon]
MFNGYVAFVYQVFYIRAPMAWALIAYGSHNACRYRRVASNLTKPNKISQKPTLTMGENAFLVSLCIIRLILKSGKQLLVDC